MAIFVSDTFADTTGTLLQNHTGQTGATWTKNPNFTGTMQVTSANRLRATNSTNAVYYASGAPASADYVVTCSVYIATQTGFIGVMARLDTTANTYYNFTIDSNATRLTLYSVTAGVINQQPHANYDFQTGVTYTLAIECIGTRITGYVNGNQILQFTDANNVGAGRPGIFGVTTASTDSIGPQALNYSAIDSIPGTATDLVVTNNALYFSPYNWFSDGSGTMQSNNILPTSTYALTNAPGAYLRFDLDMEGGGGNLVLKLDTTPLQTLTAANCPTLYYSYDGAAFTSSLLAYSATTVSLTLQTTLKHGSHRVLIYFKSVDQTSSVASGDRWTTPLSAVKIVNVNVPANATVSQPSDLFSKNMICFGDSMLEGCAMLGGSTSNANNDSTQTWAAILSQVLKSEYGALGFATQGWNNAGYGNVPKFIDTTTRANSTWENYYSGKSRLFSSLLLPAPDYVIVNMGRNDFYTGPTVDTTLSLEVQDFLIDMRAAAPNAMIFIVSPFFAGDISTPITTGITNYNATQNDSNVFQVTLNTIMQFYMNTSGNWTSDNVHPNARGHAMLAALMAQSIQHTVNFYTPRTVLVENKLVNIRNVFGIQL